MGAFVLKYCVKLRKKQEMSKNTNKNHVSSVPFIHTKSPCYKRERLILTLCAYSQSQGEMLGELFPQLHVENMFNFPHHAAVH